MKKFLVILLISVMSLLCVGVSYADDAKEVLLCDCENANGWSEAGLSVDDSTRVKGKYSISVNSVWPNAKYRIDKNLIRNSGISYQDAYFQYYIYLEDVTKHCLNGYFKLSANYNYNDADGNDVNETEIFKWSIEGLNLVSGWNFVSVKFTDMTFVGDATQKQTVFANLEKFFFVDPAKSIPGATGPIWETMYMLKVNIDEIKISDTDKTIAHEDIVELNTTRYGDVSYKNGVYEGMFGQNENDRTSENVLIIVGGVALCLVINGAMVLLKVTMRRKAK